MKPVLARNAPVVVAAAAAMVAVVAAAVAAAVAVDTAIVVNQLSSSPQTNFPGFNIPHGSSARFTVLCSARNSSEAASGHHGFLAKPMPCSPEMAPFHAITWRNNSSSAASALRFASGSL